MLWCKNIQPPHYLGFNLVIDKAASFVEAYYEQTDSDIAIVPAPICLPKPNKRQ
jgi:hypothetical protein